MLNKYSNTKDLYRDIEQTLKSFQFLDWELTEVFSINLLPIIYENDSVFFEEYYKVYYERQVEWVEESPHLTSFQLTLSALEKIYKKLKS